MIICETEFKTVDPKDKDIALTEVDYYAWSPPKDGITNHRLSLRKRFSTGNYELYRKYVTTFIRIVPGVGKDISLESDGAEEIVIATPDLQEAIDRAGQEVKRFHNYESRDKICRHAYPLLAHGCKSPDR